MVGERTTLPVLESGRERERREKDKESERGCQKVRMSDERWKVRMEGTVVC